MKIFWSWQSDRDPKLHHYFVRDALKEACKLIAKDADFEEAERPEVDHDTKNSIGTQDITKMILEKIAGANVFVADMTPVGITDPAALRPDLSPSGLPDPKYLQNPNVMSELGYAEHALTQDRIVLVANSAHYPGPQALPFDWRHRSGPKTFNLPDGATKAQITDERKRLALVLKNVITPILVAQRPTPEPPPPIQWQPQSPSSPGIWVGAEQGLELKNNSMGQGLRRVDLISGVRVFARIAPTYWNPPARTALEAKISKVAFHVRGNGGDWGSNGAGALAIWGRSGAQDEKTTWNATQWFQQNGEVWGVSASCFGPDDDGRPNLSYGLIFEPLDRFLSSVIEAIEQFGGSGPIGVKIGAGPLKGTYLPGRYRFDASEALQDTVIVERTSDNWTSEARRESLKDFWNSLLDAYGKQPVRTTSEFEQMVSLRPLRKSAE